MVHKTDPRLAAQGISFISSFFGSPTIYLTILVLVIFQFYDSLICVHFTRMDKHSMEKLREASAAEAEAASAVWQAVQAISAEETSVSDDNSQAAETVSDGSDTEGDVHLHPRAVCTWSLVYY